MTDITTALLDPFISCCVGRRNDYALQVPDGRYTRVGRDLTYETLFWHLEGTQTLGTYVISELNDCRFAVFDSDAPTGLFDLAVVQMNLTTNGIPSYLELSRRGAHLWVFLSEPTSPVLVRTWLLPFCPAGVEFYPKQEAASWEHPGSLIRLPLGIHLRSGERYPFVTLINGQPLPLFSSVVDALGWFETIQRAMVSHLPTIFLQRENGSPPTQQNISFKKPEPITTVGQPTTIRDWCLSQDPIAVISHYVTLDEHGRGHCPFGSHHDDGIDSHPSLVVYRPSAPSLYCWYCHVWQQGGSLFDFLIPYPSLRVGGS